MMKNFKLEAGELYASVDGKNVALGPAIHVKRRVETGGDRPLAELVLPLLGDTVATLEIPLGVALDATQLLKVLGDRGYPLPGPSRRRYLAEYVRRQANAAEVVFRPDFAGWYKRSGQWSYYLGRLSKPAQGSAKAWRKVVGKMLPDNRYLILTVCAALAAILIRHVLPGQSFILHFVGRSGVGKSTLLSVGQSISSDPRDRQSWNGTTNGIQGYVQSCRDSLCTLDEIGQGQTRQIREAMYPITNGGGRLRSDRSGALEASPEVGEAVILSSGEVDLRAFLAADGLPYEEGFDARFLALPVDDEHPAVDELHGRPDAGCFVRELIAQSQRAFGAVGPDFAKRVEEAFEPTLERVNELVVQAERKLADMVPPEDQPRQFARVVPYFALLAAAGIVAREEGVLDLEPGQVRAAVTFAIRAWASRQKAAEQAPELLVVARLLEAVDHLEAQQRIRPLSNNTFSQRAQFAFRRSKRGCAELVVPPELARNWFKPNETAAFSTLRRLSVLKSSDNRYTASVRVPDREGTVSMIVIDEERLNQFR